MLAARKKGVNFRASLESPVSCVARAFLSAGQGCPTLRQARMPAATSEVGLKTKKARQLCRAFCFGRLAHHLKPLVNA